MLQSELKNTQNFAAPPQVMFNKIYTVVWLPTFIIQVMRPT